MYTPPATPVQGKAALHMPESPRTNFGEGGLFVRSLLMMQPGKMHIKLQQFLLDFLG